MSAPGRPRRRTIVAVAIGCVLGLGFASIGVVALQGGDDAVRVSDDPLLRPHAMDAAAAAPAAPTIAVAGAPPLPRPLAPPTDPDADVPITPAGEIEIPSIGLVHPMYEGVWETVLNRGPGHWPGSAEPGGWGNAVYGGHRVTYSRPFRNLDRLKVGDEIIVRKDGVAHTYRVTDSLVVDPTALWIVDQHPGRTITLFTCHPPGSAAQRLVIHGELLSSLPIAS